MTVSTKGAAGSIVVTALDPSAFDKVLSGETVVIDVSKPKNSFTESINPKLEFGEALAVTTNVMPMTRLNTIVRKDVEYDEVGRFDIVVIVVAEYGQAI